MRRRIVGIAVPLLGAAVFSLALWALHRELRQFHLHQIMQQLHQLPLGNVLAAVALTAVNYLVLSVYDSLALRYVGQRLPYRRIAFASFASYAFSNNVGLSFIGPSAVRYRLYSLWGLSALDVAKVVVFASLSLWLGAAAVAGVLFAAQPLALPAALELPFGSLRLVGIVLLLAVAAYLLVGTVVRTLRIRSWEIQIPPSRVRVMQVGIAALDWCLSGSVLYTLLSPSAQMPFHSFLQVYLVAQAVGIASHVPGGLGVFETAFVLMLSSRFPAPAVLGPLLAFRGIYYLLPLMVAGMLLGLHEVALRKEAGMRAAQRLADWAPSMVPQVFAVLAFLAGMILLFSGATPALPSRLELLEQFMPLAFLEAAHFLGSVAGMGLILVARGLYRRVDAAYYSAVALLAGGIVFSLARGLDYDEAIILTLLLLALIPCRGEFTRGASVFADRFSPGWAAAIVLALVCTALLVGFSHKHTEYSNELWWRFSFREGSAPRAMRAMVGAAGLALFLAVARLLRPAAPPAPSWGPELQDTVKAIVQSSPTTYAWLALLGDKTLLVSDDRSAFVMYAIQSRSWIALGDPIGAEAQWPALVWRFKETAEAQGGRPAFHNVAKDALPLYVDVGLTLFKIGEGARVPLEAFSLEGGRRRAFRRALHRAEDQGCTFQVVPQPEAELLLPDLKAISDAWLLHKNTREKRFSLGFFSEDYVRQCPVALVRLAGKPVAFANLWLTGGKEEMSPDLMRYSADAPPEVMEYLFVKLMLWGKEQGYQYFDLGNAPLSGIEARPAAPLWNKFGVFVYSHGEHFYNFQGLRQFKERFDPVWEPRYLACPGGLALPRVLVDLAALVSGGVQGIVAR